MRFIAFVRAAVVLLAAAALLFTRSACAEPLIFGFDTNLAPVVLASYLSRAVTHAGLCASAPDDATATFDDDLRMLGAIGAKFVSRAANETEVPGDDEAYYAQAAERAAKVHAAERGVILQAALSDSVSPSVEKIIVPNWAFRETGIPPQARQFRYADMLADSPSGRDQRGASRSIPDITKRETRLWLYYRARRYIDSGFEAIDLGNAQAIARTDPANRYWSNLISLIRAYAARKARRHYVILSARSHGLIAAGRSLVDFNFYPLPLEEVVDLPMKARIMVGKRGSIIGRSLPAITPAGSPTIHMPYLLELDSFGASGREGTSGPYAPWVWGYDTIGWFAHLPEIERNRWLRQAEVQLRTDDPAGHLALPTRRALATPANGASIYQANMRSEACPTGFNQEEAIRALWAR